MFGVPLLYTMEVWWIGSHSRPRDAAVVLVLLMVPVFALNRTAGFRETRDQRVVDAVTDTIEAVAVGLVVTAIVLIVLREIRFDDPLAPSLGKIVYESVPFCLGIGVARHFLHGNRVGGDDDSENEDKAASTRRGNAKADDIEQSHGALADLGVSTVGAVFIALSIAPTDEVPLIASALSPAWLLLIIAASLVASYAIVFVAGFSRQEQRHAHRGAFQRPITETVVCYLLALLTALVLLWSFRRGLEPWPDVLNRVVVLGFPAAIGGAAGRLAI